MAGGTDRVWRARRVSPENRTVDEGLKRTAGNRLRCIALLTAVCFAYSAHNAISICRYSHVYEVEKCDVAIVLGAAASDDGVSEVYRQRLNHAVELYRGRWVERIIVTGGLGEGNRHSDAAMAGAYLESRGIPDEAILLEEESTITQENLENAMELMRQSGYRSALIVSDPLHMKRAMLLAEDMGMDAHPSPTQSSAYRTWRTKLPFLARETFFYIGYRLYRLLG